MMMRLSVSVGEENYHGAFDDDDPVYEGKKQSSANAWGNKSRGFVMQRSDLPPGMSYAVLCHPICKPCPVNVLEKNVNPPVAKVLDK